MFKVKTTVKVQRPYLLSYATYKMIRTLSLLLTFASTNSITVIIVRH